MEKTKAGITIRLFGAALYFIALFSFIPLVVAAGYVLVVEENPWLKRVAVKAVAIVVFFAILHAFVGLFADTTSFISTFAQLVDGSLNVTTVNRIVTLLRIAINIIQAICLLVLGFKALKMGDVGMPVDGVIGRNM